MVAIDLEDFDPETGQVEVHGKGNRERLVYLANGGLDAVRDWIVERGDAPGPLLYRILKGGRIEAERITEQAIYDLLRRRAKKAGVKDFSPHDCRRTLAGEPLRSTKKRYVLFSRAGFTDNLQAEVLDDMYLVDLSRWRAPNP